MTMTTNFIQVAAEEQRMHLSEEQIDAHLVGDLETSATEHLSECALCTEKVAQAAEPMASFRDVTMAWSERRSATMPMPAVTTHGLVWQRRMGWVTATFVLGFGIALVNNGRKAAMLTASVQQAQTVEGQEQMPGAAAGQTAAVTAAPLTTMAGAENSTEAKGDQFAADNSMLKAVDVEVNASAESPAALGLETVSDGEENESGRAAVPSSLTD